MTSEAFPLIVLDADRSSVRSGLTWQELSHALRTPLNSVLMLSQLMCEGRTGALTSEQQNYLDVIHRNGKNLAALLDDVQDLTESDRVKVEAQPIDFVAEARAAIAAIDGTVRPLSAAVGFDEDEAWPTFAGDARRFRRVLTNLIARIGSATSGPVVLRPGKRGDVGFASVSITGGAGDFSREPKDSNGEFGQRFELGDVIAAALLRLMGGDVWATDLGDAGLRFTVVMPTVEAA